MPCPDGLEHGFGIGPPSTASFFMLISFFGSDEQGFEIFKSGSGMLLVQSGTLHSVLTAAHILYDHRLRRRAIWVAAYFERNGDRFLASRTGSTYAIPDEFADADEPPSEWDFGLLRVNPLVGGPFGGIPIELSSAPGRTRKMIVGYPIESNCAGTLAPYNAVFQVAPSSANNYGYVDQPSYEGLSGAPLLATDPSTGQLRSFGHHIRGGDAEPNRAIRYSQPVHDRIVGWG